MRGCVCSSKEGKKAPGCLLSACEKGGGGGCWPARSDGVCVGVVGSAGRPPPPGGLADRRLIGQRRRRRHLLLPSETKAKLNPVSQSVSTSLPGRRRRIDDPRKRNNLFQYIMTAIHNYGMGQEGGGRGSGCHPSSVCISKFFFVRSEERTTVLRRTTSSCACTPDEQ